MQNSGARLAPQVGYVRALVGREIQLGMEDQDRNELWRQAAREWWARRATRIEAHMRRVQRSLRRHAAPAGTFPARSKRRPRRVWCVELKRSFATLTAAAAYVDRTPANILQAINRRGHCGRYAWEDYDSARHSCYPDDQ